MPKLIAKQKNKGKPSGYLLNIGQKIATSTGTANEDLSLMPFGKTGEEILIVKNKNLDKYTTQKNKNNY
jgi:hypothetical protein